MRLQQTETPESQHAQPRYDALTLHKVTALAERLQASEQESFSAAEMESIASEVGIKPNFIRQALGHLEQVREQSRERRRERHGRRRWRYQRRWRYRLTKSLRDRYRLTKSLRVKIIISWWAAGWSIIPLSALLFDDIVAISPFIWIVGGILLSVFLGGNDEKPEPAQSAVAAPDTAAPLNRAQMLDALFTLQHQLEGQKQPAAFLSVDVVGSSEMKRNGPALAAEHSFNQYREWVQGIVRQAEGEVQSHAGDGMMCIFPTPEAAVWTARHLQDGIAGFNATQNHLPTPFQIRCGVTAGDVGYEPGTPLGHLQSPVIDQAAELQKSAQPGDIVVSGPVTAAALTELGAVQPLSEPVAGETAFSWRPRQ